MVLDVHGHLLFAWVVAGTFGHSPGEQDAVEFKAEIVVQTARPVLLHDEAELACPVGRLGGRRRRLGRDAEVALLPIAGEGRRGGVAGRGHAVIVGKSGGAR